MRTDAINWFASSELCRSLQDGGKTPLTAKQRALRVLGRAGLISIEQKPRKSPIVTVKFTN